MFQFPGFPSVGYVFPHGYMGMPPCGFPHSDISGSCGCTLLTRAFRSVPRPSSALDAKASPVCPYSLFTYVIRRTRYSRLDRTLVVCFFALLSYLAVKVHGSLSTAVGSDLDPGVGANASACPHSLSDVSSSLLNLLNFTAFVATTSARD